ncbi:MAG: cysteine desulfurase family protein [Flavobacteriaceae bacterium]|nr:cysteine desulfurase family protein [Flavobacteriaceae bacterium]
MERKVYFDNAATTPMRKEVIDSMHKVLLETFGNPSSTHSFGRSAKTQIETARKSIAKHFNADPQEIIFTSGGTESDNMLLRCAVQDLGVQTVITSKIEHHAILHAVDFLAENKLANVLYVKTDSEGLIDFVDLVHLLKVDRTKKLVSLMHINNEIGSILDLDRVSKICQDNDALFHTDAVQGVGHYEIDLNQLKIDFLSAAAHKFHGPKGIGFSFVRKNSGLNPFILGGSQERGLRAGTESVHNIVGMAKALEIAYSRIDEEQKYLKDLKTYAIEQFTKSFPEVHFNGCCSDLDRSSCTLVNVSLPVPEDKVNLLNFHLDLKGIACSKGSACQSGSTKGSHVIEEVVPLSYKNNPAIRFSFSIFNTKKEIDYLIQTLESFVKE